jgi:serine/threonine-protein kinase
VTSDPQRKSGNTIDRYEVIAELARGGMGTVLLARVAGAGGFSRLYALKLLHKHLMYDSEFVDMLLDEARIAARIHHPNAVAIHEVGFNELQGYYLVMDYVEGVTLWDVNQQLGPASPGRVKLCSRIVYDALLGLEAAHTLTDEMGRPLKVVHRDMSPQNILVGVDGIARVTDFGIAKAAARISGTTPGQVKGKLAYMAPEQARGKDLDHRVDIFAMGVVLWEMLTGQRLFKRAKDNETIDALLVKPIPHVRELVPSLPEELDAVVAQALVRDPQQRFGSARAMAVALESAARTHGLLADAHDVGNWVRGTFARAIDTRREAIRQATTQATATRPRGKTGELSVPAIPEVATVTPAPDPKTVTDLEDEWEKHSQTVSGFANVAARGAASARAQPHDDALDLMKTTAMPSDAQKPAALKAAIEQYRQTYGAAPGAAPIAPQSKQPTKPSGTVPPAPRLSPKPDMKAVDPSQHSPLDQTVPVSSEEMQSYYAAAQAQMKSAAASPMPSAANTAPAPPTPIASLPSLPSPYAPPGFVPPTSPSPGNPYGYAQPNHPTAMYPAPNALRASSPSQAPVQAQPKRGVAQIVLLIVGAIALVATGALVALKML